jgi:hypothetical protein
MVAVELFGVGVTPRHHCRTFGNAQVGRSQPHPMLVGQADQPLDRGVQQFGIGWEGDGLGLHRSVDRDSRQIARAQRAALVRDPQALGQQKLQLGAEPLTPMAQIRALVWKSVLEELLAGEVLEIRVVDPALANAFIRQPVKYA